MDAVAELANDSQFDSPEEGRLFGGKVEDREGKPVPGATVVMIKEMPDGTAKRMGRTITDDYGEFVMENIPAGTYSFIATVSELATTVYEGIDIQPDGDMTGFTAVLYLMQ
jgi:protocatechuate 3,4-dioxygenase beta subunit